MTIHESLMKAIQDDGRRAGERNRLLREARRARRERRGPAGDGGFRACDWADVFARVFASWRTGLPGPVIVLRAGRARFRQ